MTINRCQISHWASCANFRTGRDVGYTVATSNSRIEALLRRLADRPFTRVVADRAYRLYQSIG